MTPNDTTDADLAGYALLRAYITRDWDACATLCLTDEHGEMLTSLLATTQRLIEHIADGWGVTAVEFVDRMQARTLYDLGVRRAT